RPVRSRYARGTRARGCAPRRIGGPPWSCLFAPGRELDFEGVDLADQIVEALGHVAAQLVRLAQLRLEPCDALLALRRIARQSRVLVAKPATAIGERLHGALEAIEAVALVGALGVFGNRDSPARRADRTEHRGNASSRFPRPEGTLIRRHRGIGAATRRPDTHRRRAPLRGPPTAPRPRAIDRAGNRLPRRSRARWSRSFACPPPRCRADRASVRDPGRARRG